LSARLPKIAVAHLRLWIALAIGVLFMYFAPHAWTVLGRVLLGWNCGTVVFLILIWVWIPRLSSREISCRFEEEDESAPVILLVVTLAALLSLLAIVAMLASVNHLAPPQKGAHIALAGVTVVTSWLLVATMFAIHYTDLYYSAKPSARPLTFRSTPMPVFWDFAYFSFTIAAACQTSDVSILTTSVRKVALAHTLVSFIFNVSILGFAVNVSAGLLSAT
jgi:uncharacterized membrane protein